MTDELPADRRPRPNAQMARRDRGPDAPEPRREPGRVALARYLAAHGPVSGDALCRAVGMTPDRFWLLINHSWFGITGKGYVLTDQGRTESAA